MRLYIEGPSGALFDYNDQDEHAVAPTDRAERAQVFSMLVSALGLMTGVTQQSSLGAKVNELGQLIPTNLQCPDDRRSGAVLHLVRRPDAEA
jgi:hypothetical protein